MAKAPSLRAGEAHHMPNKQIKQRGRKSAHRPQSSPLAVGMHEINVRTWEEFEENLRDLKQAMDGGLLGFLFRGHGDSRWQLDTTLQRNGHEKYPVRKYWEPRTILAFGDFCLS